MRVTVVQINPGPGLAVPAARAARAASGKPTGPMVASTGDGAAAAGGRAA